MPNYGYPELVLQYIRELAPGNFKGGIKEVYVYVFYNDGTYERSQ